jgi:hypothetical protein
MLRRLTLATALTALNLGKLPATFDAETYYPVTSEFKDVSGE